MREIPMKCPNCGVALSEDATHCGNCGAAVPKRKEERPVGKKIINVGDRAVNVTLFNVGNVSIRSWHVGSVLGIAVVAIVLVMTLGKGDGARCELFAQVEPLGAGSISKNPLPGKDNRYDKGAKVELAVAQTAGAALRFDHWIGVDGQDRLQTATVVCNQDRRAIAVFAAG